MQSFADIIIRRLGSSQLNASPQAPRFDDRDLEIPARKYVDCLPFRLISGAQAAFWEPFHRTPHFTTEQEMLLATLSLQNQS